MGPVSCDSILFLKFNCLDSYECGLTYVNGGNLEYPKVNADLDPVGYDRCTTMMVQMSQLSDVSYDAPSGGLFIKNTFLLLPSFLVFYFMLISYSSGHSCFSSVSSH